MSEISPESLSNEQDGTVGSHVTDPQPIQSPLTLSAGAKSPASVEVSKSQSDHQPDRLQFLERLVATNEDLRKAYQKAFESKPDVSQADTTKAENTGNQPQGANASSETTSGESPQEFDIDRLLTEQSEEAHQAYEAKLEESHQQVVGLFDKLLPGLANLVETKSKTEGQKAFLGHLEEMFEQALIEKYPPKLWFSPKTHQELVGRLVPLARQLAREMGLLTPEGAFKFAYSRQTAGMHKSAQAQGAAMNAGYVEPSSQNTPAKERAFDKAFQEKDTLAMVRALFRRNQ